MSGATEKERERERERAGESASNIHSHAMIEQRRVLQLDIRLALMVETRMLRPQADNLGAALIRIVDLQCLHILLHDRS